MTDKKRIKIGKYHLPLWILIIIVLCGLCTLCTLSSATLDALGLLPTSAPTQTPTITPTPTNTSTPTITPTATNTPLPTAPLTTQKENEKLITNALGTNNRDLPTITTLRITNDDWIHLTFPINDNLTGNMIKSGAEMDITNIAKALCQAGYCNGLTITGTFPMQDTYGNITEDAVVQLVFTPETLNLINWENFSFRNIYTIADTAKIHPEFQP